ncbi:MAG: hypothetical protein QW782_01955 [Candidatus Bathyarchaeia archaeon]
MPHKRSLEARQRRIAKRIIMEMAYRDRLRAEAVNRLSMREIMSLIGEMFNGRVHLGAIPRVEEGEILYDSRGMGSLQRRNKP